MVRGYLLINKGLRTRIFVLNITYVIFIGCKDYVFTNDSLFTVKVSKLVKNGVDRIHIYDTNKDRMSFPLVSSISGHRAGPTSV